MNTWALNFEILKFKFFETFSRGSLQYYYYYYYNYGQNGKGITIYFYTRTSCNWLWNLFIFWKCIQSIEMEWSFELKVFYCLWEIFPPNIMACAFNKSIRMYLIDWYPTVRKLIPKWRPKKCCVNGVCRHRHRSLRHVLYPNQNPAHFTTIPARSLVRVSICCIRASTTPRLRARSVERKLSSVILFFLSCGIDAAAGSMVCNSFQLRIQTKLVHFWCQIRCRLPCASPGHTSDL